MLYHARIICNVTLQYNVQNLCEKTDHYEANEKKKGTEESFKLFTKPRREMAITIKKKKNQTDLFLEKASPPYFKKKRKKNDLMSLSAPVKK